MAIVSFVRIPFKSLVLLMFVSSNKESSNVAFFVYFLYIGGQIDLQTSRPRLIIASLTCSKHTKFPTII